ncbi:MAG: lolE [Chthoniobacteraceae bacterium]|nr:lolE [Chthoniobacteraceae bacterium]
MAPKSPVKLPFSLFLALRYLKPKRTFVSIITLISILGVTFGVAVLILVIAVMTGFDRELRDKVLGFNAHILVTNGSVMRDWRPLDAQVQATPGIVATAPFVQGPVIVEFAGRRLAPKIRGVELERELKVTDIRSAVKWGELDLDGDKTVIGRVLADQLEIGIGDKLIVYSPGNIGAIIEELKKAEDNPADKKSLEELRSMVLPKELVVTGIFESGHYDYDSEFLLVPLYIGQELYELGDGLHGLTARTIDPNHPESIQQQIQGFVPKETEVLTWMDMNKSFFDAVRMERNVMFFLLLFIVIVAAFGIMNTLITVTVQKTREIGIMKALGATTYKIVWVFLAQGMLVGAFGNLTGLALGMAALHWRNEFKDWLSATLHMEIFPQTIYHFSAIPAQVVPHDVAVICISAFVMSSLAALIPAYFAARLDPVVALRYE